MPYRPTRLPSTLHEWCRYPRTPAPAGAAGVTRRPPPDGAGRPPFESLVSFSPAPQNTGSSAGDRTKMTSDTERRPDAVTPAVCQVDPAVLPDSKYCDQ